MRSAPPKSSRAGPGRTCARSPRCTASARRASPTSKSRASPASATGHRPAHAERATIAPERRRPCFVYIDEAQEYADEQVGELLNQARKYRVGLTLAHQNLEQLDTRLRATVMASTSIKLAGGVSAKDAEAFAREMGCAAGLIRGARKRRDRTELACWIKNVTGRPLILTVPLGAVERLPRLSEREYEALIAANRARYCGSPEAEEKDLLSDNPPPRPPPATARRAWRRAAPPPQSGSS